ncbi:MAG: hypothetical protein A2854_00405 [Parcubacteria group bacterium RIFCSPHIGHO2_01_FULL_56_18]|nr:MAG: hypothetical protein A2854_00405 [Parcubacteria group bacterium RIFCSPHIGHO2_01_FULL_56_18]
MAKLPAISGKELVRILERCGFLMQRQTGSHVLLEHSDGRVVVIPVHANKDLPKGTLRGILRDVEITPDQLRELM